MLLIQRMGQTVDFELRRSFGRWIRQKRKDAGLTIRQLAENLEYSDGRIKRIESGYDPIPIKKIFGYSKVLRLSINEILNQMKWCDPDRVEEFKQIEFDFYDLFLDRIKRHSGHLLTPQDADSK